MYHFDDSAWPVTIVRIEGATMRSDAAILQAHLAAWLVRGQRFGIVATLPTGEVEDERGALKARRDVLHALKSQLAQWCAGLAGLTASVKHTALLRPIALIAARYHLGCDGAVFEHEADARVWLSERL